MQGISTSKHQHLVDALLQLERVLGQDFKADTDLQEAAEYRGELERMHEEYEHLLMHLSELIVNYNELSGKVKIQFLSKKLKELKKQTPQDRPVFQLLMENIRLAYGT